MYVSEGKRKKKGGGDRERNNVIIIKIGYVLGSSVARIVLIKTSKEYEIEMISAVHSSFNPFLE